RRRAARLTAVRPTAARPRPTPATRPAPARRTPSRPVVAPQRQERRQAPAPQAPPARRRCTRLAARPSPTRRQPTAGPSAPPSPRPEKSRNMFTTPLIALSAVLVVLVIAIVIVVVVRSSGGSDSPGTPIAGGSSTPAKPLVDECVVGTWETTSYTEEVPVPQVGPVPFSLTGKGATMKFGKDGKGVQDFGTGTNFTGNVTASGQTVKVNLKITGDVKYDFRTNDGGMTFSNLVSNGKATVSAPSIGFTQTEDFKANNDPSNYTCS